MATRLPLAVLLALFLPACGAPPQHRPPDARSSASPPPLLAPAPPPPVPDGAPLAPRFELAASLPWGKGGLVDPTSPRPGVRAARSRQVPKISALTDGGLWISLDPYSAIVERRGSARLLSFMAAGLEAYLDAVPMLDGSVTLLGAKDAGLQLVMLDPAGDLRMRRNLPKPNVDPPLATYGQLLTAYGLIRDRATGDVLLWSEAEHVLRAVSPRDLSLGSPVTLRIPAPRFTWWIQRGTVHWVESDATGVPNTKTFAFHALPLPGGTPTSVALDPAIPSSDYDSRGSSAGHDLRNDLRMAYGMLPSGMMVFGATKLVWVRPTGVAALSVPFDGVVRAGDGVAVAVPHEANPMTVDRVERWVAGRLVNTAHPEERGARGTRLLSADARGFALLVEMPYACMPGSGGLPNRIDTFTWSDARPVREEGVGCSEETRASLRAGEGHASLLHATVTPDGAVLVPGVDRDGVFVVRVDIAAPSRTPAR